MLKGHKERQQGSIDEIRKDHLNRYLFACSTLAKGLKVLDLACGCGYGSWFLHGYGMRVTGVDISDEAIAYAKEHYQGPEYFCQKAEETKGSWDAIVTFETLEHLANPEGVLSLPAKVLIASVPNEEKIKFVKDEYSNDQYPHLRHYTPMEFEELLNKCGWKVEERFCQKDKKTGDVVPGTDGVFLIYAASKR